MNCNSIKIIFALFLHQAVTETQVLTAYFVVERHTVTIW